ncbi:MAG: hypothetical protein AB7F22_26840 [Reyranella sp.]|uniref:hypothetical protein n=1 Tax=Reyranella sp. TaxID=1929291 RepID=UPI003D12557B
MKIPGPRVVQTRQRITSELASLKELALSRRAASLKQQMLKLSQLREIEGEISGLRRRQAKGSVAQLAD